MDFDAYLAEQGINPDHEPSGHIEFLRKTWERASAEAMRGDVVRGKSSMALGPHFAGVSGVLFKDGVIVARASILNPHAEDENSLHYCPGGRVMSLVLTEGTKAELRQAVEEEYRLNCIGFVMSMEGM